VLTWQEERKREAEQIQCVYTLLGRARRFPSMANASYGQRGHIERAAINTPVQVLYRAYFSCYRNIFLVFTNSGFCLYFIKGFGCQILRVVIDCLFYKLFLIF